MPGSLLLSTAYLPPAEYIAHIARAGSALIEIEENYCKQTYRNRCVILSAGGIQNLSVPVLHSSIHKTVVRDARIDYSKRWQQVHTRAIVSAYGKSPYFPFYNEIMEKIIMKNHEFLLDLNQELLSAILKIMKLKAPVSFTTRFIPVGEIENDFRYTIAPKRSSEYSSRKYLQVFSRGNILIKGLSIIDLIFNTGPDSSTYL
jgi:hypothetical protein